MLSFRNGDTIRGRFNFDHILGEQIKRGEAMHTETWLHSLPEQLSKGRRQQVTSALGQRPEAFITCQLQASVSLMADSPELWSLSPPALSNTLFDLPATLP